MTQMYKSTQIRHRPWMCRSYRLLSRRKVNESFFLVVQYHFKASVPFLIVKRSIYRLSTGSIGLPHRSSICLCHFNDSPFVYDILLLISHHGDFGFIYSTQLNYFYQITHIQTHTDKPSAVSTKPSEGSHRSSYYSHHYNAGSFFLLFLFCISQDQTSTAMESL